MSPAIGRPAAISDDGQAMYVHEDDEGWFNAYDLRSKSSTVKTYLQATAYEKPFVIAVMLGSQSGQWTLDIKQRRTWQPRFQLVGAQEAGAMYVLTTIRAKPPIGSKDPGKETIYCGLASVPIHASRNPAQPPLSQVPGQHRIMEARNTGQRSADFLLAWLAPPKQGYHEASAVELQAWTIAEGRTRRTKGNLFGRFDGLKLPATAAAIYPKRMREGGYYLQPSIRAFDPIRRRAYYGQGDFPGAEYDLRHKTWTSLRSPPGWGGTGQRLYDGFYELGKLYLNASQFGWNWSHPGELFVASDDRRSWERIGPYRVFGRSPSGKYWVLSGGEGRGLWLAGLK